jgi:hypothetical protein
MKIYQIVFESDKFQYLFQKDRRLRTLEICLLGKSRRQVWPTQLELEVTKPKWPKGVFHQWVSGELILTPKAQEDQTMVSLLEVDGEFLPVIVDGKPLLLHNITRFADCVDEKRSKRGPTIDGVQDIIRFPCFHAAKVPLGIHFRLREYPGPRYVATDPSLPPEKDFYQWYHQQDYKGLKFRLLWDSEKPDELIRFY